MNSFDCGKNLEPAPTHLRDQQHDLALLTPRQKGSSKSCGTAVWEATTAVQNKTLLLT